MSAPVFASASSVLATLPSPSQGVWYLGPVPLRAYALCIVAGIVVAIVWGNRRWMARGGRPGTVTDIAVFAVPFGLVGGRLYHVATDWQKYFGPGRNPLDALKIWEGGLGIWGAVALGALGAWIGCRRRGIPLTAFADAVAPGIVLAQAVGRLGNWFNQELYGAPTSVPWGLELYRRVDPSSGLTDKVGGVAVDSTPIAVVHPTFLYELLWNVAVALLLVGADRWFRMGHGRVFALYVAGYTAGRVWIEMMRTDDATHLLGIRINVFTAVIVFLLAVLYLVLVRGKREDPASVRGTPLPGESDDEDAQVPVGTGARSASSTADASAAESGTSDGSSSAASSRAASTSTGDAEPASGGASSGHDADTGKQDTGKQDAEDEKRADS